jgi:hypothetical protein
MFKTQSPFDIGGQSQLDIGGQEIVRNFSMSMHLPSLISTGRKWMVAKCLPHHCLPDGSV